MKKLIRVTSVPLSIEKLLGNQLSYMNEFYEVIAVSSDEKNLKRIAQNLGVKYHAVEMTRKITPIKDLLSILKMYQFFRKEKPEIVHSHTPKAGLVAMIAAYFSKVPVRMHTVAGLPLLEATGFKRLILNLVEKITYSFATKVYPNSFKMKDIMIEEKFCKPQKLKVLGNGSSNGIDLQHFDPEIFSEKTKQNLKNELNILQDDFVFIFIGRLVKDKGINELVSAFSSMSAFKNIKLLLVGPLEQSLDPILEKTLYEIENNPQIITTDFVADVRPYLAISNCLVLPSYREGFPNAVLQAGAMALPCIVSDINGCNEIITDGVNGLIIPAKSEIALKNAMLKLIDEPELYQKLKLTSRKTIENNYSHRKIWEELRLEYDSF